VTHLAKSCMRDRSKQTIEGRPEHDRREQLREILAGLDEVERVRVAAWAYDTFAMLDVDAGGRGLLSKYVLSAVRWGSMPSRQDLTRLKITIVDMISRRIDELPGLLTVVEPVPEPPPAEPSPEADADMVLDPSYQAWLAAETVRTVEELESRARKASAEATRLEAQARAMREAAMALPAPSAWETKVAGSIAADAVGIDTEAEFEQPQPSASTTPEEQRT
jgi:hypothetical protein